MSTLFAIVLLLHGVAHLVGFLVPWGWVSFEEAPYKTTILSGRVDLGPVGIRVLGVFWLLTAAAFALSGWQVFLGAPNAIRLVGASAGCSLLLSILSWPDARIGVLVNAAILSALTATQLLG